jgi:hypothetical protein
MAEYKSFHYLMHATPEAGPVHYAQAAKPLTFDELYSPRDTVQIHRSEKSFWRTRDRIEFCIYENRKNKVMFVTCRNLEVNEIFRTIFLSLEAVYNEVQFKARGNRDMITKKTELALSGADLSKAAGEYALSRLNIKKEPIEWPQFPPLEVPALPAENTPPIPIDTQSAFPGVHTERMCTFDKLSSDTYDCIEISRPEKLSLEGIDHVKLHSSAPASFAVDIASPPPAEGSVINQVQVSEGGEQAPVVNPPSVVAAAGGSKKAQKTSASAVAPAPSTAKGSTSSAPALTVKNKKAAPVGKGKKVAPEG